MAATANGRTRGPAGIKTYVSVAAYLTAVTAIEVAVPYLEALRSVAVPLLILLATVKLAGVALYFMHLRGDRRILTWVFGAGLVVAVLSTLALIVVMMA